MYHKVLRKHTRISLDSSDVKFRCTCVCVGGGGGGMRLHAHMSYNTVPCT